MESIPRLMDKIYQYNLNNQDDQWLTRKGFNSDSDDTDYFNNFIDWIFVKTTTSRITTGINGYQGLLLLIKFSCYFRLS